jgi:hypothetical protein
MGGAGGTGGTAPPVTGTAVFTQVSSGVELGIALTNCSDGKSYPIHVHVGTSCMDTMAPGAHWDPPRGEGIPNLICSGSRASEMYTRADSDPKPWSIGGSMDSNLVGHVVVLHDPDDTTKRIACGAILTQ